MTNRFTKFDQPTQVAFWDSENDCYLGGIAFGTNVICGCCGSVIPIDEIYEFAPSSIEPIKDYGWVDMSNEILQK